MSDTPITDAALDRMTGELKADHFIRASDMRALELAANGLRDALRVSGKRCPELHHDKKDRHGSIEPCPVEARIESALAAFTALTKQPAEPSK